MACRFTKDGHPVPRRARSNPRVRREVARKSVACVTFAIERHRAMLLFALAALLLKSLVFAPLNLWPLAFVCLVPWLVMIGGATRAPRVYFHSYLFGLAFFIINMRWMYPATGWGYVALSAYLAVYFPLMACPLRHVVRRRRLPLGIVVPFVWVGGEMVRAVVISGFPWFYLSHGVHRVLTLIQVSDIVGAYGVSFVIAAVNGAVADAVFAWLTARRGGDAALHRRQARVSGVWAGGWLLVVVVYGQVQLHRDTTSDGPRIAVVQGDFLSAVFPDKLEDHDRAGDAEKMQTYLSMMESASAAKPDIVLLPETPWRMRLNPEERGHGLSRTSFAAFQEYARRHEATVVTGSASIEQTPYDMVQKRRYYNSATVFYPDGSEPARYDKVHLVPFGEFVPFRYGRFRFLYFWLNRLTPFSGADGTDEFSLTHGDAFNVFTMTAPSNGRSYRFGIPICYEDVMPYVSRAFVSGGSSEKRADFLLNISNDGWFGRGVQQPQHLAICAFRAVENRVGIARAVNTGISALIDPDGRIHDAVAGDPANPWPGVCGYSVARVRVDSRHTLYSRYGDWFAWLCALCWLAFFVDYWVVRARAAREEEKRESAA